MRKTGWIAAALIALLAAPPARAGCSDRACLPGQMCSCPMIYFGVMFPDERKTGSLMSSYAEVYGHRITARFHVWDGGNWRPISGRKLMVARCGTWR